MRQREKDRSFIFIHTTSCNTSYLIEFTHATFEIVIGITFVTTIFLANTYQCMTTFFLRKQFTAAFIKNEIHTTDSKIIFSNTYSIGTITYFIYPFNGLAYLITLVKSLCIK